MISFLETSSKSGFATTSSLLLAIDFYISTKGKIYFDNIPLFRIFFATSIICKANYRCMLKQKKKGCIWYKIIYNSQCKELTNINHTIFYYVQTINYACKGTLSHTKCTCIHQLQHGLTMNRYCDCWIFQKRSTAIQLVVCK